MYVNGPRLGTYMRGMDTIRKIWTDHNLRLHYFMRDINPKVLYEKLEYFRARISMRFKQVIYKYRLIAHIILCERVRWQNKICKLYENDDIENEYYVFISCR